MPAKTPAPHGISSPAGIMRRAAALTRNPSDALSIIIADLLEELARQYDPPGCDSPDGTCNGCEQRWDFVLAARLAEELLATTETKKER